MSLNGADYAIGIAATPGSEGTPDEGTPDNPDSALQTKKESGSSEYLRTRRGRSPEKTFLSGRVSI